MAQIAPCERGEARRLQSLLVCARYNLEARLSLGWLNEAGAESGGAVPLSGARRLYTPMRRTVSIGIVVAEVGTVSSPTGAVATLSRKNGSMTG